MAETEADFEKVQPSRTEYHPVELEREEKIFCS